MNIILLNLVCSDFSVSIIGNPFTLTSALNHGWMFGETVCSAYGFFMSLLGNYDFERNIKKLNVIYKSIMDISTNKKMFVSFTKMSEATKLLYSTAFILWE